ncbi:MAG: hypothetical protein HDT46_09845 [Ruminococcaceae bacterium]|nr:hypothetical protein [Oscillospiraceae bacterium]
MSNYCTTEAGEAAASGVDLLSTLWTDGSLHPCKAAASGVYILPITNIPVKTSFYLGFDGLHFD